MAIFKGNRIYAKSIFTFHCNRGSVYSSYPFILPQHSKVNNSMIRYINDNQGSSKQFINYSLLNQNHSTRVAQSWTTTRIKCAHTVDKKNCIQCARQMRFLEEETGVFHKSLFEEVTRPFWFVQMDLTGKHELTVGYAQAVFMTCIQTKVTKLLMTSNRSIESLTHSNNAERCPPELRILNRKNCQIKAS